MAILIENGSQLLEQAKQRLQKDMFFLPFKDEVVSAVALCRPFSGLDSFLKEVASGYLGFPVYQEVCINVMDAPTKANKFFETYRGKHLVITKADSLEEKILNFSRVYYIADVTILKLLTASSKWEQLVDFCRHNRNHFLVFGTLVNDKYVHHGDIPALDIITLVPQFLDDTGEPQELEVGRQLLKKKKNGLKK
jgi:hypothetical protein